MHHAIRGLKIMKTVVIQHGMCGIHIKEMQADALKRCKAEYEAEFEDRTPVWWSDVVDSDRVAVIELVKDEASRATELRLFGVDKIRIDDSIFKREYEFRDEVYSLTGWFSRSTSGMLAEVKSPTGKTAAIGIHGEPLRTPMVNRFFITIPKVA